MKRFLLLFIVLAVGCSSKEVYDSMEGGEGFATNAAPASAQAPETAPAHDGLVVTQGESDSYTQTSAAAPDISALMFIKTANIELRTDNFDYDISQIRNTANVYGGYFESSNLHTPAQKQGQKRLRRYNATVRVPVANYENAKAAFEMIGRLHYSDESSHEVTAEYFNTQSRLETLKTEEERLLVLIDEAIDMRLLIELEQRLSETRTQIELYEARLLDLEDKTSYSTIVINVTETTKEEMLPPPDDGFMARLISGFTASAKATLNFLQGIVVFLAYIIAPVTLILILAFIARFVIRRSAAGKKA